LYNLPITTWKEILKKDDIKCNSEKQICLAVLKYGNLQKNEKTRVQVLSELLPLVRYAFISPQFVMEFIEPLSESIPALKDCLYDAYRFKSVENLGVPKSPALFNKPYLVRRKSELITWCSTKKSPGVKLDALMHHATHTGQTNTWQTVLSDQEFSSGQYSWNIKVIKSSMNWVFIGVAETNFASYTSYIGACANTWGHGQYIGWGKAHAGNQGATSTAYNYTNGDIINVILDMDAHTLNFAKNGTPVNRMISFTNLPAKVRAGISLYGNADEIEIVPEDKP